MMRDFDELEAMSRTPQGVRGLKYKYGVYGQIGADVAPRKGCVD